MRGRKGTIVCMAMALAGCHDDTLHLVSGEKGNPAEIRIDGAHGDANWTWGPDLRIVDVSVERNELTSGTTPPPAGAPLVLRMADGTRLEFGGQNDALICKSGCDRKHMPIAWYIRSE